MKLKHGPYNRRPYNRGRKSIDWSGLGLLTDHTVAEIAEIKGCSRQSVSRALKQKGLKARPLKAESVHKDDTNELIGKQPVIELPKVKIRCEVCKQPLTITLWNKVTNMAYCDNFACQAFHRPVMHPKLKIGG